MNCSATTRCLNPKISKWEDEFFCFNCFQSFIKDENVIPERASIDKCCKTPDIHFGDIHDVCTNCGSIHQKMINELPYMEGDEYQTVSHKSKKVHVPYKYLKYNYPEIKYEEVYSFILNSIQFIQNYYNLKRKPYTKYAPFLYNFYKHNKRDVPEIKHFNIDKDLILDQNIIDRLYELLNTKPNNNQISNIKPKVTKKPTNDEEILKRYYYFNKSKNKYFKKKRYCQFNHCLKVGNFMEGNIKFCNQHTNNGVNINDKSTVSKCQFVNCKKTTKTEYCSNHKYKCLDNECDIRIMKNNSYCKIHK